MTAHAGNRGGRLTANVLIVLGALFLLWLATGVSLSQTLGRRVPDLLLSWWGGAPALAASAERRLTTRPPDLQAAYDEAMAAWQKEPLSIPALRLIAATGGARGEASLVPARFAYVEQLTRRDTSTELWLIEAAVQRGDIPGALAHYDHAMRTSLRARTLLFPIIARAGATEPSVRQELGRLLSARPPYWRDLVLATIDTDGAPVLIPTLVTSTRLDMADENDRGVMQRAVNRLAGLNQLDLAYAISARFTRRPDSVLLVNGDFAASPLLTPFDWALGEQSAISGGGGFQGGQALDISSTNGAPAMLARQMIRLPAGEYDLSMKVEGDFAQPPRFVLSCLTSQQEIPFRPAAPVAGTVAGRVTAVPGCSFYWLELRGDVSGQARIDDVRIARAS